MPEFVSVIVPTWNSARHLETCLSSVRAQTYGQLELVVVDNHSDDGTLGIAQRLADMALVAGPERSAQRNAGAHRSGGAHLLFIDSDMVLEPAVVEQALALVNEGAGSVVIPEVSRGEGFWGRCKVLERSCYLDDETIEAARFFPRASFEQVGGFDETMPAGPEDWDLHLRIRELGGPLARTQAVILHDEGRPRLRMLMAKKFYYGRGMGHYIRKHPESARRQLRVLRPAFLRHRRRLMRTPILAGGMLFMKACEFGAGAAGLLSEYVQPTVERRAVSSTQRGREYR